MIKQILKFGYNCLLFFPNLFHFIFTSIKYLLNGGRFNVIDIMPMLYDRTSTTNTDPHYFYQSYWAANRILASKISKHIDVASQLDLIKFLSIYIDVTFVDIRPITVQLPRLEVQKGSILHLPFADNSVESLSCLHVIEHIGFRQIRR